MIGSSGSDGAGWVYRNGKVSLLPKVHSVAAAPNAINARGDIIGSVTGAKTQTSVIWPVAHPGTVRALLPANLLANTISDSGLIGGSIGPFDEGRPYVGDRKGSGHTLSTGLADPQGNVFQIRGHYAVGEGPILAGRFPVVWNLTTGSLTTYPNVRLSAVADDGTTVGEVTSTSSNGYAVGITDDGHTIAGTDRTPVNTEGPYSQVALLWHC